MNKDDFMKLINIIVDKKIKEILPKMVEKEIRKYMESGIEPDASDMSSDIKNLIPYSNTSHPVIRDNKQSKSPQTEDKKWSKNPVINKILSETANSGQKLRVDPSDPMAPASYQQLMESEYENIEEEFTFNTKSAFQTPKMPAVRNNAAVLKQQVMMDGAPPEVANAMVKDYSGVLKKMNAVAKQKRGGGLPLGNGVGEDW